MKEEFSNNLLFEITLGLILRSPKTVRDEEMRRSRFLISVSYVKLQEGQSDNVLQSDGETKHGTFPKDLQTPGLEASTAGPSKLRHFDQLGQDLGDQKI